MKWKSGIHYLMTLNVSHTKESGEQKCEQAI